MAKPLFQPALILAALCLPALPALAQSAACAPQQPLTALQKRLLDADRQSPDGLRQFVQRAGPIYQVSWHDSKVWLQGRREAEACLARADAAAGAASGPQATVLR